MIVSFRARLGFCQGRNGRPSVLITKEFEIYVGNLENTDLSVPSGELFGFFTGSYEQKIVKGRDSF